MVAELTPIVRQKRRTDPLSFFAPNSPGQRAFFESQSRGRAIIAGNRFGKTHAGAAETCYWLTGRHPYRKVPKNARGWVLSVTHETQRDIIQPKLMKFLTGDLIAHKTYRMRDVWDQIIMKCALCGKAPAEKRSHRTDGNERWWCPRCNVQVGSLGFKSYDQGREKYQGTDLDFIWEDEEPPKDIHDEALVRLVDRGGSWWMTMTPVNGMGWTYDGIANSLQEGEIEVFGGSMYDNPALPREEIARVEDRVKNDPAMRDIRIYGRYAILSGLIFKDWDPAIHEVAELPSAFFDDEGQIRQDFDIYCGVDTGQFFGATYWLVDFFGNLWGFAEHYAEKQSLRSNAMEMHRIHRKFGIWPTFILDITSQFEVDLAEVNIPCNKADVPVDVGLEIMHGYMTAHSEPGGHPRMYVVAPAMSRWLWERQRYQWDKPAKTGPSAGAPKTKPVKKDDHLIDSSRFVFAIRPQPSMPKSDDVDLTREQKIRAHVVSKLNARASQKAESADNDME